MKTAKKTLINTTMTRKEFNQAISAYIKREKDMINEHEQIAKMLMQVEGKPINNRTFSDKILGDKFKFHAKHSLFCIKGELCDHLIGYENSRENFVSVEKSENHRGFRELDACSGYAAQNRIKQIEATDLDKAFKLFKQIDKHFNALRTLFGDIEREKLGSYNFPPYYDLLRAIYESESNSRDEIKLSDFYYIRKYRAIY